MWIVRLALQRPYTFVVMALLILILSPIVIIRTPVDIFPEINIPVISIIWQFQGLSAQEMADRIGVMTKGPESCLGAIIPVDLPRPRRRSNAGFGEMWEHINALIENEEAGAS